MKYTTYFIIALFVMNTIDAFATMFYVSTGIASEANPLMAILLAVSYKLFIVVKIGLVTACLLILYVFRQHRLTGVVVIIGFFAYSAVIAQHVRIFYWL